MRSSKEKRERTIIELKEQREKEKKKKKKKRDNNKLHKLADKLDALRAERAVPFVPPYILKNNLATIWPPALTDPTTDFDKMDTRVLRRAALIELCISLFPRNQFNKSEARAYNVWSGSDL